MKITNSHQKKKILTAIYMFLVSFCPLLAVQDKPGSSYGLPDSGRMRLLVPCDSSAPKIEGDVSDKEWTDGVALVGLNETQKGQLADNKFKCFLKSDGKNFYFAFRTTILNREMLLDKYATRDSDVYDDDSWELYIYPEVDTNEFYQVVF